MKCNYGKPVQWTDNSAKFTGVLVLTEAQELITRHGAMLIGNILPSIPVLVAHSYTRELEFVPLKALSDYPSEPIPQP